MRNKVSHNVASLTKARTFRKLYIDQIVDVLERANVRDDETDFFSDTNYFSPDNEEEARRPWTRLARRTPPFERRADLGFAAVTTKGI